MKIVYVIFDSLNQRFLPGGSNTWVKAHNFERLEQHTVRFDRAYVGSMACMPARREMHTGRYNFLHCPWGPLEPFDESFLDRLNDVGVHSHLVTDHPHYFSEGGSTYHTRFATWEFERGQEGDPWKGVVDRSDMVPALGRTMSNDQPRSLWDQEFVNRAYRNSEADYPHAKTFARGLEFIETNHDADSWFLQIETFDAHEPFHTPERIRSIYPRPIEDEFADWPTYGRTSVSKEMETHWRYSYAASITMIDEALGSLLDLFDQHDLWSDTMLVVGTDHGFLLGEHDWWGKNLPPWYNEIAHVPLYIWDPRSARAGEHRDSFVQTIDLAPTFVSAFELPALMYAQVVNLANTIANDSPARTSGIFGAFGGALNYTDGKSVYMRAPLSFDDKPFRYTLMPMNIRSPVAPETLRSATLSEPFAFTQGAPMLRFQNEPWGAITEAETMYFDLETDPAQENNLVADMDISETEEKLAEILRETEAPDELYERYGLGEHRPDR